MRLGTLDSLLDAISEIVVVERFTKVTDEPVFQSPWPRGLVGIGGNEDGWNLMPQLDQMHIEFMSCHCGHMDVRDQTGGHVETARCEKTGCRGESLDGVTQRPQESSHGLAKEFIVFDDRDQWRFGQAGLPQSRAATPRRRVIRGRASMRIRILYNESRCSKSGAAKPWLRPDRGQGSLRLREAIAKSAAVTLAESAKADF